LKGTFCRIDSLLKNQDDSKSLKGDAIGRERANCSLNGSRSTLVPPDIVRSLEDN